MTKEHPESVKEVIQAEVLKERERIIELVEGRPVTIHPPVGGVSNVEWIRKQDLINQLKA